MQEKLHTGELYLPTDEELVAKQTACLELLYEFNQTCYVSWQQSGVRTTFSC